MKSTDFIVKKPKTVVESAKIEAPVVTAESLTFPKFDPALAESKFVTEALTGGQKAAHQMGMVHGGKGAKRIDAEKSFGVNAKYYHMGYDHGKESAEWHDDQKNRAMFQREGVAEGNLDPSGLLAAASMVRDFIITAEVDGKTKKFRVRGMTGPRSAKERFLKHHSMAKVLDVKEEGVAESGPHDADFVNKTERHERLRDLAKRQGDKEKFDFHNAEIEKLYGKKSPPHPGNTFKEDKNKLKENASGGATCSSGMAVSMAQEGNYPTEMINRQQKYAKKGYGFKGLKKVGK